MVKMCSILFHMKRLKNEKKGMVKLITFGTLWNSHSFQLLGERQYFQHPECNNTVKETGEFTVRQNIAKNIQDTNCLQRCLQKIPVIYANYIPWIVQILCCISSISWPTVLINLYHKPIFLCFFFPTKILNHLLGIKYFNIKCGLWK